MEKTGGVLSVEVFWAHAYFISAMGQSAELMRRHIWNRKREDERLERLNLRRHPATSVAY